MDGRALANAIVICTDGCDNGYITKRKKEGIGFDVSACSCLWEKQEVERIFEGFRNSGVPKRLIVDAFEKEWLPFFGKREALSFIEGELAKTPWVYFEGDVGTGKTYTAIKVLIEAVINDFSAYFTTTIDMFSNLRPGSLYDTETLMKHLKTVDVLILDDLGQEKNSEWTQEKIYSVINSRWQSGIPTIFTSNHEMARLEELYSRATYSRVAGLSRRCLVSDVVDKRI